MEHSHCLVITWYTFRSLVTLTHSVTHKPIVRSDHSKAPLKVRKYRFLVFEWPGGMSKLFLPHRRTDCRMKSSTKVSVHTYLYVDGNINTRVVNTVLWSVKMFRSIRMPTVTRVRNLRWPELCLIECRTERHTFITYVETEFIKITSFLTCIDKKGPINRYFSVLLRNPYR